MWLTEGIAQPFVWGMIRGDIYLPDDFAKLDVTHRRGVLGHELSHVLRFDAAINLLQVGVQTVFWFHPLVWWANHQIRAEREKCCDETTIARLGSGPQTYSRAIIETLLVEHTGRRPLPSLAVAGPVKNIEERIKTMMRPGKRFYKRPSLPVAAILMLVTLSVVSTTLVLTARANNVPAFGNPTNLGPTVNSANSEINPDTSRDGSTLYFVSNRSGSGGNDREIWQTTLGKRRENTPETKTESKSSASLHKAAAVGDIEQVRLLVSTGTDVNSGDASKRTPLHYAANAGRKDVVQVLIEAGADVNCKDKYGQTPTALAMKGSHNGVVDLLISKGADVTLDTAVYLGDLTNVKSLIESDPDVNKTQLNWLLIKSLNSGGVKQGYKEVAEYLLQKGASPNARDENNATVLHAWAWGGDFTATKSVMEFIINKGADINARQGGWTPLHSALDRHRGSVAKVLIDNGADVTAKDGSGCTVLHYAASGGMKDVVELLTAKGADISSFHHAVWSGDLDHVKKFVEQGTDIDSKDEWGWTALHWAAPIDRRVVAEYLIANGADVNAKAKDNSVPLHRAAQTANIDMAALLIDKGAIINASEGYGTPLAVAAGHSKEMVEWLLAKGANVNADAGGWPALVNAVGCGRFDIVELLLAKGADVNIKYSGGRTPLHYTARHYNNPKIVKLLLSKGADINAKDKNGITPMDLALERGHTGIVELLRKHGAKDDPSDVEENHKPTKSLHEAATNRDIEQVKSLLSRGADVNARDETGCTALHCVAKWRPNLMVQVKNWRDPEAMARIRKEARILEMAELLISQDAQVNVQDDKGNTPLHYAVEGGHKDLAELLIKRGADVNARNQKGFTPIEEFDGFMNNGVANILLAHGAEIPTIHVAALLGDLAKVKAFIDQGVPVNAKKVGTDKTALFLAARAGQKEVAKFLIGKGAEVNTGSLNMVGNGEVAKLLIANGADVDGHDGKGGPLRNAAAYGRIDVMQALLANGANTELKDGNGQTALSIAMTYQCKESVLYLTSNGADVNTKDRWDQTPLIYVARLGWKDAAEALIAKGADIEARSKWGASPLYYATTTGHADIVELLIAKGADPLAKRKAQSDETLSNVALERNHKEVVRVLAAHTATDIPEVHLAAYLGDLDGVRRLVTQSKDVEKKDKHGKTPLSYASLGGNVEIVRFLISQNAKLDAADEKGKTPLHFAAFGNHAAAVKLLLAGGADINADSDEGTPLHMAVISEANPAMIDYDETDMARLLINEGADVNACSKVAGTPLHLAVGRVQKEMVKLLIAQGANVNAKGVEEVKGGTPLHAAVFHPYGADVAVSLIRNGADVNAKNNEGATLLHLAVQRPFRSPLIELLLDYGADVNAKDNEGRTPLMLAKEKHRYVELLRKHGAQEYSNR